MVEELQRRVQDDLGGQNSDVLDLKVGAQRGPRRVRPGVLGPQRSGGVRKLNFYHQVQLRRQHLPAAPWWGAAARPRSRPGAPRGRCAGRPLRRNPPWPCCGCTLCPSAGHARAALAVGEELDEAGGFGRGCS